MFILWGEFCSANKICRKSKNSNFNKKCKKSKNFKEIRRRFCFCLFIPNIYENQQYQQHHHVVPIHLESSAFSNTAQYHPNHEK